MASDAGGQSQTSSLEMKASIADGVDPTTAETEAVTFKGLSDRYIEHAKQHGKKTWHRDEQALALYIPKGWHTRRLSDISRDEIVKLHDQVGEQHGHYSANRLVALLRSMFNAALDWKLFHDANPAAKVKQFKEHKRERFLSPEELIRVNEALLAEPEPWRSYFPLVLLTGTRRMELLTARWENVDLAARTLKLIETKNGRSLLLPLPAAAVAILEALPSRGQSEWVFPAGRSVSGHVTEPKSAWSRIRARAGVPDVRIHDLRRTLGSWLAGAGFSLPMIGCALGHQSPSSTSVYARLDLDPVRRMLEVNAAAMFGAEAVK